MTALWIDLVVILTACAAVAARTARARYETTVYRGRRRLDDHRPSDVPLDDLLEDKPATPWTTT